MERLTTVDSTVVISSTSARQRSSPGRALALLDAFAGPRTILGVSELAAVAGIPKSTAHRLLATLVAHHYVKRVGDRYCLSEHTFEMGNLLWACRPGGLRERAIPFMIELSHETHETVHLAILDNDSILYLEKLFEHRATPCPTSVGARRPAHCTALGKAILAHSAEATTTSLLSAGLRRFTAHTRVTPEALGRDLERAQDEGVAMESEEYRTGLVCAAAPILDRDTGIAIGALSISASPGRFNLRRFASRLRRASESLNKMPSLSDRRYLGESGS